MEIAPTASPANPAGTQDGTFHLWWDDEWEAEPTPPVLIEGMLGLGDFALLVGQPGLAKTFFALELAYRVAGGEPFLGRATTPGPVVYVLAEGRGSFKKRTHAWRRANPAARQRIRILPQAVNLFAPPSRSGAPQPPPDATKLITALDALPEKPILIIVDTLARASLGADENSARDMGLIVAEIDRLRHRYGCTVLAIHHEAKLGQGGPRGSSALLGAADACFGMKKSTKSGQLRLTCMKEKDLPEFAPIPLQLRQVDLGGGESSCVVEVGRADDPDSAPPADGKRKPALVTEAKIAVAALRLDGVASASDLVRTAGLPKGTVHRGVARLRESGVLVPNGDGYCLADGIRDALARLDAARQGGFIRLDGGPVLLDIRAEDWTCGERTADAA